MSTQSSQCCGTESQGIVHASPKDAVKNGEREKILFLTCPNYDIPIPDLTMKMPVSMQPKKPDAVMSVDVDPMSPTYCQVYLDLNYLFKNFISVSQSSNHA